MYWFDQTTHSKQLRNVHWTGANVVQTLDCPPGGQIEFAQIKLFGLINKPTALPPQTQFGHSSQI